jgi:F-type H+-transporting ATPase subunit a
VFILICNIISLIPWLEEPSSDLSTTLGLGITSFIYIQAWSIKANGFLGYLKGFLEPFFFLLPLNVIGLFASIISISFRLFGNIFGGFVITKLYLQFIGGKPLLEIIGIVSGLNILLVLFFVLFAGFIQAFVFSMLSLTYLSLAIQKEE